MGKTAYKRCEEIIESLKRQGFIYEVPQQELRLAIMKLGGADQRTIRNYLSIMKDTGLIHDIRETERGIIFRIGTRPIQKKLISPHDTKGGGGI